MLSPLETKILLILIIFQNVKNIPNTEPAKEYLKVSLKKEHFLFFPLSK